MATFLTAFAGFGLVMLALCIGLLVDGRRLKGSCGGPDDCECTALAARRCPKRSAA
jgi:hypothetical protein